MGLFYFFIIIPVLNGSTDNSKVLIAVSEFLPYIDQKAEGNGFLMKIVDTAFRQAGINPEYKFYPWKRAERFLKNGKAFAALPYLSTEWTKQEEEKYLLSDGIVGCTVKLFYYKRSRIYFKLNKLEDLKYYKIGAVSGYLFFYNEIFQKIGVKDIFYSDEEESALKQLVLGKVDLVPYVELHGWQLIKDAYSEKEKELRSLSRTKTAVIKEKNFNVLERALSKSSLKLLISRKFPASEELLKKFNDAMSTIKKNGTYDLILKNHNITSD